MLRREGGIRLCQVDVVCLPDVKPHGHCVVRGLQGNDSSCFHRHLTCQILHCWPKTLQPWKKQAISLCYSKVRPEKRSLPF